MKRNLALTLVVASVAVAAGHAAMRPNQGGTASSGGFGRRWEDLLTVGDKSRRLIYPPANIGPGSNGPSVSSVPNVPLFDDNNGDQGNGNQGDPPPNEPEGDDNPENPSPELGLNLNNVLPDGNPDGDTRPLPVPAAWALGAIGLAMIARLKSRWSA